MATGGSSPAPARHLGGGVQLAQRMRATAEVSPFPPCDWAGGQGSVFSSQNTEQHQQLFFRSVSPPEPRVSIRAPERQPHPCKGETWGLSAPRPGPTCPLPS